jgi:hypothetical protein
MIKLRFHILAAVILVAAAAGADNTATKTTAPVAKKSSKKVPARTRVASAPRQASPSSDRFKEIQESLISKGYLKTPANGVWDQNSIDAMRKFQEDQKMDASGKVTAKALISLGLGPKDESTPNPSK